jgi:hypothetical protein
LAANLIIILVLDLELALVIDLFEHQLLPVTVTLMALALEVSQLVDRSEPLAFPSFVQLEREAVMYELVVFGKLLQGFLILSLTASEFEMVEAGTSWSIDTNPELALRTDGPLVSTIPIDIFTVLLEIATHDTAVAAFVALNHPVFASTEGLTSQPRVLTAEA